jgi:hypothetical protein
MKKSRYTDSQILSIPKALEGLRVERPSRPRGREKKARPHERPGLLVVRCTALRPFGPD